MKRIQLVELALLIAAAVIWTVDLFNLFGLAGAGAAFVACTYAGLKYVGHLFRSIVDVDPEHARAVLASLIPSAGGMDRGRADSRRAPGRSVHPEPASDPMGDKAGPARPARGNAPVEAGYVHVLIYRRTDGKDSEGLDHFRDIRAFYEREDAANARIQHAGMYPADKAEIFSLVIERGPADRLSYPMRPRY